ncbi:hypothetical protein FIBSPDRAFT_68467 [Athelia psychrophila]|uniref:NACHT domain-containing protein n=1 Tax=Athelia psychrophila TaxID=1759441 RepID=A0A166ER37_9AGAM|nr:hypothetical protein FIBSPDRAFT_68467 [Fibularhizoctonia sp. CBS 109695]
MAQPQNYLITFQGIEDLSWTSTAYSKLRKKIKPNLYIEVHVDHKRVARTRIAQNNIWGETLTILQAKESSELLIKLKHKSSLLTDPCFGIVETTIGNLLSLCKGHEVTPLKLTQGLKKSMYDAQGVMSAAIKLSDDDQTRQNILRVAGEDVAHIDQDAGPAVPSALINVAATLSNNEDVFQSLGAVLGKVHSIVKVTVNAVDVLAKVHPYADTAWKILSAVHKAYEHQKDTDVAVVTLFKEMAALYSFVDDLGDLPGKIKQLEHAIVPILAQTTECALFFREYTGRGFVGRFLDQATSNHSQTIGNLSATLTKLREGLNSGVHLHTAFMSSYTRDGVDKLVKSDILKVLEPARMNAAERPMCLPGTMQDRQNEIIDWLMNPSDQAQNVWWLRGAAGLGKSTLATTIAEHFRGLRRRGAFLFFDRNSPIESSPSRVICTLAYQLAEHDEGVRSAVSAAIERDPQLATAPLITQFKSLLCEPLAAASIGVVGPIVIVIDALDECGDAKSRQLLLNLLSSPDFAKLPSQFRFLITSRSEPDIEGALYDCKHVKAVDSSKASENDIMLYIKYKIEEVFRIRHRREELNVDWLGEKEIQRLVQYADGFFIWAATVMGLLFTVKAPVKWLTDFLLHDRQVVSLHELYEKALLSVDDWKGGETTDIYRRILGLIVVSQVPLTDVAIGDLLGLDQESRQICRTALRSLSSVIQWSEGQSARTLHKSFPDYLTDQNACSSKPWFIDVKEHEHALTLGCLRVMNDGLHFNMGHLKTSHIANADIPDLSAHVAIIPQSVSYACQFWGHHLGQTIPRDPAILDLILHFFELKFLYWLEVLSLLGEVSLASRTLVSVIKQCPVANSSSKVYAFAQDGLKFVGAFAPAMACSAPHIYLSCIPFAPRASLIKQQYMHALPNVLAIELGMDENWPALQQVFNGHTLVVTSVVFSPDGQHIASGSYDNTIRIWDVTTGALIAGPFEGHTSPVSSVAFSPDGQHIASGSWDSTIRIWDATTGTLIAGPFEGHAGWVKPVALSPDGQRIASGSKDTTIRIWDATAGTLIAGPLEGHTDDVRSVVFSPDGQRIASGSEDKTIRIWDADTGILVIGPLKEHGEPVESMALSPDGKRLVTSSGLNIRVLDIGVICDVGMHGNTKSGSQECHSDAYNGFGSYSHLENGWMLNSSGDPLFYVPHDRREGLWWPHDTAVISPKSTRLDLTCFVHGEDWVRCHI